MKRIVRIMAAAMSAVLMLSVCSCNKADLKKSVDPVIGLMEDSIGKSRADAEKMFEDYFGVELEGKESLKSGSDANPLQTYFYPSVLTKDGVTFTSLAITETMSDGIVYSVELNNNNLNTANNEYNTSSEKKSEIKNLCKAMNKAVEERAGKPSSTMPLFENSKLSFSNRYKTDKCIYIVSNRDLTEMPEEEGHKLIDTTVMIHQIT